MRRSEHMTDKPAAFSATFSDLKVVKTRGVAQFIFEAPLEAADHALNVLGGMPQPMKERWVAIARMEKPE
jgi:hypothetical protein